MEFLSAYSNYKGKNSPPGFDIFDASWWLLKKYIVSNYQFVGIWFLCPDPNNHKVTHKLWNELTLYIPCIVWRHTLIRKSGLAIQYGIYEYKNNMAYMDIKWYHIRRASSAQLTTLHGLKDVKSCFHIQSNDTEKDKSFLKDMAHFDNRWGSILVIHTWATVCTFQKVTNHLATCMKNVLIIYISKQHRVFTLFLPKCYCYGSLHTDKLTMIHDNLTPIKFSLSVACGRHPELDTTTLFFHIYCQYTTKKAPIHQQWYKVANYWTSKVWLKTNGHCQPAWC